MAEKEYRLSEGYSIADIENIYHKTVLNQDFYGATYGANWSLQPYIEMAQLLKTIFSPKRHLDIGCGEGLLVQAMRALGMDSWGIDFSKALIARAQSEIRPYLTVASAENWIERSSLAAVDCITYMEVFEHLPISILKNLLKEIRTHMAGRVFLTIPSYGVDEVFGRGIIVNNGTPQWKVDMELNRPFCNIVLENDLPHLGHITLASYRWWTEFFLTQGYIRDYDLERQCSKLFKDILERHRWNPYILISSGSCPPNLIEKNGGLLHGWYEFESIGDEGGRWTNGYAQSIWFGEIPLSIHLRYTLPSINVIRDLPVLVVLERLVEHPEMQFAWQLAANPTLLNNIEREKPISSDFRLNPSVNHSDKYIEHNIWRISLLSPSWKPVDYSLSTDRRKLSIFVNKVLVNGE